MTERLENKSSAIADFIKIHDELTKKLAELKNMSDNHFYYDPENINFGHVGNISYVNNILGDLLKFLQP